MKLAKDDLLAALRLRYDHYSAQSILDTALVRAGLADLPSYDETQVAAFRAALDRVGDRLQNVHVRLEALLATATPAVDKPVDKARDQPSATATDKPIAPGVHETEAPKPVETTITLAGVDTKDGDQILVCGGFPALGNWDPEKAATMKRDGMHWLATLQVPLGTDAQFKFLRRMADGTVIWEDGENRQLVAKPRIEATWR